MTTIPYRSRHLKEQQELCIRHLIEHCALFEPSWADKAWAQLKLPLLVQSTEKGFGYDRWWSLFEEFYKTYPEIVTLEEIYRATPPNSLAPWRIIRSLTAMDGHFRWRKFVKIGHYMMELMDSENPGLSARITPDASDSRGPVGKFALVDF